MCPNVCLGTIAIVASLALCSAKDVIIIGAGISGLAAARRLVDFGGINVKILEARPDRYGGRIHTDWKTFNNQIRKYILFNSFFTIICTKMAGNLTGQQDWVD